MKNAILVSSDARWRTVIEGTLLAKGWQVVSAENLDSNQTLDPGSVQSIVVDTSSIGEGEIAGWVKSERFARGIPVVLAPGFEAAESICDSLEPSAEGANRADSKVRLRFWGVRGSIPTPGQETSFYGGNTACVEFRADGETIILDAGSGLRPLGEALIREAAGKPVNVHMLLTHTHWDHIQGFPFFRPAYQDSNHIRILCYAGVRHDLEELLGRQMDSPFFPVSMCEMMSETTVGQVGEKFQFGSVKGQAFYTNHPGKCAGYRFETSAGVVIYVPDNELNVSGQATHMPRETAKHLRQRFVQTISGAQVLIHDAQYTRAEYAERVGWGHSCMEDVVEMAGEAGVEHLLLFHHDPTRKDESVNFLVGVARDMVRKKGWKMRVDAAREGAEIAL